MLTGILYGTNQFPTFVNDTASVAVWHRAEFINYAASVAVRQRELDTASLYLHTAEEIAWTTGYQQRYSEVLETFRSMQLVWPNEARVTLLQDKIQSRRSSF